MDFDDGMFGESQSASPATLIADPVQQAVGSPEGAPIDFQSAIDRFEGDRDFVMDIIGEFKSHLPERMKEIHNSLQAGDMSSLCRLAHNLKGVSLNINAGPIAQVTLDLEKVALHEDLAGASTLVSQLELEVARLEEFLSNTNH